MLEDFYVKIDTSKSNIFLYYIIPVNVLRLANYLLFFFLFLHELPNYPKKLFVVLDHSYPILAQNESGQLLNW